ncbi:FkbM family methyltransferase [Cupriavidus sp. SS-3]|nr:FkbM family methyltransferase [Cupriavidus sp. SS-3]
MLAPEGALYIGAGAGMGQLIRWLYQTNIPSVVLIEADEEKFAHLDKSLPHRNGWHFRKQAVAAVAEPTTFFRASLSSASGLLDPDTLRGLWPNIQKCQELILEATSIERLQHECKTRASWLIVDCFSALPIICGAGERLNDFDVILARVILGESFELTAGSSEEEVVHFLTVRGFRHLVTDPDPHPGIGHALFVRDARAAEKIARSDLCELRDAFSAQNRLLGYAQGLANELRLKHREEIQELEIAAATAERRAFEYQRQVTELNAAVCELEIRAERDLREESEQYEGKIAELKQSCEEHARQAGEYAEQLEKLNIDRLHAEARISALANQVNEMQRAASQAEVLLRASEEKELKEINADKNLWDKEKALLLEQLDAEHRFSVDAAAKIVSLERYVQLVISRAPEALGQHQKLDEGVPPPISGKGVPAFGDANVEQMLRDIAPYFRGRSLTYVDIGAFVGEVFIRLKESGCIKIREAHLFEPNPVSYTTLKAKLENFSLPSLHCYNIGVASSQGARRFISAGSMTKMVDAEVKIENVSSSFVAECRPLDSFREFFTDSRIDILKIDVEGKELDILNGARDLLGDQMIDLIYLEVGMNIKGTQQTYFGAIDATLQGFGYRAFRIYEQTHEWQRDSPVLRRCNVAYMSDRFAAANPYSATMEIDRLKREAQMAKVSMAV